VNWGSDEWLDEKGTADGAKSMKVLLHQSRKSVNPANPDSDSGCPKIWDASTGEVIRQQLAYIADLTTIFII